MSNITYCSNTAPSRPSAEAYSTTRKRALTPAGSAVTSILLDELSPVIKNQSLCGLGKTAPNPVMTALMYFREEFKAHIEGRTLAQVVARLRAGANVAWGNGM